MESVQVLLDLVFILLLINFLKNSASSLAASAESPVDHDRAHTPTVETENQSTASLRPREDSSVRTLTDSTDGGHSPPSSGKKDAGKMTVEVNVSRPLVALVEDSEKNNPRALVFGVCCNI